jgi:hypothetical protein
MRGLVESWRHGDRLALRPVYDRATRVTYTWQLLFGAHAESDRAQNSVTVEEQDRQQETLAAAASRGFAVDEVRAFNLRVVLFAEDVRRAANKFAAAVRLSITLRDRCERCIQGSAAKRLAIPGQVRQLSGVAFPDVLHHCGQAGAVIPVAGHGVGEGLCDPGSLKRIPPLIEGLGDGAYPDVSDPLALGHRTGRRLLHKCGQHGIRDRYF